MLLMLSETSLIRCQKCVALSRLQQRCLPLRLRRTLASAAQAESYYKILDVKKDASQAEIKAAFVKKSKQVHPDCNHGDPSLHESFVRLNEAYTVLSRITTRREYDFSLQARLEHQQRVRHHQGMHSTGASHMPGSGTYHGAQQEKAFWDETIFEMRDRNMDSGRFYKEDEFYGIKGVRRVSNTHIVLACFVLMGIGALLHIGALQYSSRVQVFMDERDRKANAHLENARRHAREHGNVKQLERLKAKIESQKNGVTPVDS